MLRRKLEEEEARRIYEITPIISKPYISASSTDTTKYISWLSIMVMSTYKNSQIEIN